MKYLAVALTSSLILLSACSGANAPSSDSMKLNYVTTVKSISLNPKVKGIDGQKDLVFILGKKKLGLEADDKLNIFDFEKKRIFKADPKAKTYEEHSLYLVSASKHAEAANRAELTKILKESNSEVTDAFDPFNSGCELGMIVPGQEENPGITVAEKGNTVEYSYKGKVVTSVVLGDPLPESMLAMMEKFYVYNCNVHPFIRKDLLTRKRVPKELNIEMSTRSANNTIKMVLKNSDGAAPSLDLGSDYKISFAKGLPLSGLQERIYIKKEIPVLPKKQESFAEAKTLVAKKEPVDALLTMINYSLCTGEQAVAESNDIMNATKKDPIVKKLQENLRPTSKAGAVASYKILNTIDSTKFKKGYVIEVLKANVESLAGGNPSARFIYALNSNPALVYAYKDLGTYYFSRYDVQNAWDAFDLGRKIKPDHVLFKDINKLEQGLEESHPEYF
ncbi:MAG: hypothetical protein IPG59_06950 [Candidatus Melainabacteria bacterium]|nr:MAG: hypothetical protein IPG59_06950 [Candidatus Melainabacteria bacterium]